ncbi:MAG: folate-binding protein YgfZ [Mycobacteriales bacterium]
MSALAVSPASWRSPLLGLPGAVPAEGPDAGVALHYGDPYREQRHLAEDAAYVDQSGRDVVRIGGPDRLRWLHDLTTQHLSALAPMSATQALLLSPHGHVEHHLVLADDGESTWIDVEPGTAPALLEFLERMRFLLRVEPADVSADWAVLSVAGPSASAVVSVTSAAAAALVTDAIAPWPGGGFARRRRWPDPAYDLVVPRGSLAKVAAEVERAGAAPAGLDPWTALRVAGREPRFGYETDHKTIPNELGWLQSAVHLDKGCYRGQETVARVHNLGRPPRRLVLLHLDGSDSVLPAHGDEVSLDGRSIGFVTTAARHYELGPIALAMVKRSTPDDAVLLAGGTPAAIEPGGEAESVPVPSRVRLPRL